MNSPKFKIDGTLTLDSIIGEVTTNPGNGYDEPPEAEAYTFGDMVCNALVERLLVDLKSDATRYRSLREKVATAVDDQIAAAVTPMVTAALDQPIQRTNDYGKPIGDPFDLQQIIVKKIGEALSPSPNRSHHKSPMDEAIKATTEAAVKRELDAELTEARAEIRQRIRAASSSVFADALASAAGV